MVYLSKGPSLIRHSAKRHLSSLYTESNFTEIGRTLFYGMIGNFGLTPYLPALLLNKMKHNLQDRKHTKNHLFKYSTMSNSIESLNSIMCTFSRSNIDISA